MSPVHIILLAVTKYCGSNKRHYCVLLSCLDVSNIMLSQGQDLHHVLSLSVPEWDGRRGAASYQLRSSTSSSMTSWWRPSRPGRLISPSPRLTGMIWLGTRCLEGLEAQATRTFELRPRSRRQIVKANIILNPELTL